MNNVKVKNFSVGKGEKLCVIAGPCLLESAELGMRVAEHMVKLSEKLGDLLWLAFSGGEIFLRSDLVEIVRIFYKNNRPAIILLPTNGLLTDIIHDGVEAIVRACPQSTIVVKLSLYEIS